MMNHVTPPTRTIVTEPTSGAVRTVRFGDVVVSGPEPAEAEVEASLRLSHAALEGLKAALLNPGIRLERKPDVPLYWADPDTRGVYIRELNGKFDRGIVKDGDFEPIA